MTIGLTKPHFEDFIYHEKNKINYCQEMLKYLQEKIITGNIILNRQKLSLK